MFRRSRFSARAISRNQNGKRSVNFNSSTHGLPDISGYDVARTLRTRHGAALYLAALTGWDEPADRARSLAAGFDQHLVKPANLQALLAVMTAAFRTAEISIVS